VNSKDYQEIAKICKKHNLYTSIALDLATYFEREDKRKYISSFNINKPTNKIFNRQQFLKDAGVK